jgi:hypothetical protein
LHNCLIAEEQHYDSAQQTQLAAECIAKLNPDQQVAFEKITSAITTKLGEIFFLHSAGGTGKTFLYNTLCYYLHSQEKIVLHPLELLPFSFKVVALPIPASKSPSLAISPLSAVFPKPVSWQSSSA